jgi:hypothetical protein
LQNKQKCNTVGISFTNDILSKIDADRGLIPRSVFLREILKKTYTLDHEIRAEGLKNQKQVGPLTDSLAPASKEENGSHG